RPAWYNQHPPRSGRPGGPRMSLSPSRLLAVTLCAIPLALPAQDTPPAVSAREVQVRGVVVDEHDKPVTGATVLGEGVLVTPRLIGTLHINDRRTDDKGAFTITIPLTGDRAGLSLRFRARRGNAFTARAVELRGADLDSPVRLKISTANA